MYRYHGTIKVKTKNNYLDLEYYDVKIYDLFQATDKNKLLQEMYHFIKEKKLNIIGNLEIEIEKKYHQI